MIFLCNARQKVDKLRPDDIEYIASSEDINDYTPRRLYDPTISKGLRLLDVDDDEVEGGDEEEDDDEETEDEEEEEESDEEEEEEEEEPGLPPAWTSLDEMLHHYNL